MHSVWEKLNPYHEMVRPMCEHDLSIGGDRNDTYVRSCCAPAYWRHSWRTQDMPESHHGYYCEQHALEHGLGVYVDQWEKSKAQAYVPESVARELLTIETQSQETPVPYGGAPGEIEEEKVCDECGETIPEEPGGSLQNEYHKPSCSLYEEDYGAYFDNQERCPRCNENHKPPICNPAGFREED